MVDRNLSKVNAYQSRERKQIFMIITGGNGALIQKEIIHRFPFPEQLSHLAKSIRNDITCSLKK